MTLKTHNFPSLIGAPHSIQANIRLVAVLGLLVSPSGGATVQIDYDASSDPNTGNSVWEDVEGTETGVDLTLGTGVSYNGSPIGAPASVTAVYSFDGSGTATAIGGYDMAGKFSSSASISFEAFFRTDNASTSQFLWDDGGTGAGIGLTISGGNLQFGVRDNNNGSAGQSGTISSGQFVHTVGVVDMTNDVVDLYINGTAVAASAAFSGNIWAGTDGGAGTTSIGTFTGSAGSSSATGPFGDLGGYNEFDGDIAFFRFYEEALTSQDASDLYAAVIPEPSALSLFGVAGLLLARRRR